MRATLASLLIFLSVLTYPNLSRGQVSGNIAYSGTGGRSRAEQRERAMRVITKDEMPPTATSMFVEASVLMNVKADEYVAVFGVATEGATPAECQEKMDATVRNFTAAVMALGVGSEDVYVDFITQNRVYGYELQGDILQERLVGFELKRNFSIHYTAPALLEKLTLAAAESQIFDLIKVDYVIKDLPGIQDKLMEHAAEIINKKISRSERLLGIKLEPPAQVYAEKFAVHYPTQMYDSYTAQGAEESPNVGNARNYSVRRARKSQTSFLNSLDGDGFDAVINPVITEPVVQCTVYLKIKYEVD